MRPRESMRRTLPSWMTFCKSFWNNMAQLRMSFPLLPGFLWFLAFNSCIPISILARFFESCKCRAARLALPWVGALCRGARGCGGGWHSLDLARDLARDSDGPMLIIHRACSEG